MKVKKFRIQQEVYCLNTSRKICYSNSGDRNSGDRCENP